MHSRNGVQVSQIRYVTVLNKEKTNKSKVDSSSISAFGLIQIGSGDKKCQKRIMSKSNLIVNLGILYKSVWY